MSAIKDIENCPLSAQVISVDVGDHVGLSDIAELSATSRQAIDLCQR